MPATTPNQSTEEARSMKPFFNGGDIKAIPAKQPLLEVKTDTLGLRRSLAVALFIIWIGLWNTLGWPVKAFGDAKDDADNDANEDGELTFLEHSCNFLAHLCHYIFHLVQAITVVYLATCVLDVLVLRFGFMLGSCGVIGSVGCYQYIQFRWIQWSHSHVRAHANNHDAMDSANHYAMGRTLNHPYKLYTTTPCLSDAIKIVWPAFKTGLYNSTRWLDQKKEDWKYGSLEELDPNYQPPDTTYILYLRNMPKTAWPVIGTGLCNSVVWWKKKMEDLKWGPHKNAESSYAKIVLSYFAAACATVAVFIICVVVLAVCPILHLGLLAFAPHWLKDLKDVFSWTWYSAGNLFEVELDDPIEIDDPIDDIIELYVEE